MQMLEWSLHLINKRSSARTYLFFGRFVGADLDHHSGDRPVANGSASGLFGSGTFQRIFPSSFAKSFCRQFSR